MSRSIVLSNGELCVALDEHGLVRDLYFPHVGLEDHVRGHYIHRVGIWVEGQISWLSEDSEWQIVVGSEPEALASAIVAKHPRLQIEINFKDIVYNEENIFLRRVTVKNLADRDRDIKLYMGHQFEIYKSHGGDTAYYDPESHAVVHYKGRRVFLIAGTIDGEPFQDYATGLANFGGHEGTHRDADDGVLSKNPIEHGPADSVMGFYGTYAPGQSRVTQYWLCAAETIPDAHVLSVYVETKTPAHLIQTASDFWRAWANAYNWNFYGLAPEHISLFKKSLMYIRAHVDESGGILASVDSDMLQYGLDTYSYVWPRDAAYTAMALDQAGDINVARKFFEFAKEVVAKEGYFMHKYSPDRSLGSSWHPWVRNGHSELPIQEDETALVVIALREHFSRSRDVEFLELIYSALVENPANFMLAYRDPVTKLPLATYDLWEEKRGTSTFTASSVYGALVAAADLSEVLGKKENESQYRTAAKEIQEGILAHLWDDTQGIFVKLINREGAVTTIDRTLDMSSAYGVFSFGVLPPHDPKLVRAFEQSVRRLSHGIPVGGLARYEGDQYYRLDSESAGNPWITTTLWYAQYLIAKAKKEADFSQVREIFSWVTKHASPSGVLPEQLNPKTGDQLSATPLTWSHAAYVHVLLRYLDKLEELGISIAVHPAP